MWVRVPQKPPFWDHGPHKYAVAGKFSRMVDNRVNSKPPTVVLSGNGKTTQAHFDEPMIVSVGNLWELSSVG